MANESYIGQGATVAFNGTVGADVAFSMENVSAGAGRISAAYDLGAFPRAYVYKWECEAVWQATPTQYRSLDLYVSGADTSTDHDGDPNDGSAPIDEALADVDMVRNMQAIGSVVIEDAATTVMRNSGIFVFPRRYIAIVGINNDSSAALNATDSNFNFKLTPLYLQLQ